MEQIFQSLKKNPVFILFLVVLTILPATALTLQQNSEAQICHPARLDGEISSSTLCNITIYYSNGSKLVDFAVMDNYDDTFCYNLTTNHTKLKGIYDYELTCTANSYGATESFQYLVNLGGIEPSNQRTEAASRTIYIFFGLAVLTFISLFFVRITPAKITLFLLTIWFLLMGINSTYITMQDEVLNSSIETFFSFFLTISFYANYFIFFFIAVIWLITFIVSTIERRKVNLLKEYG